MVGKGVEAKTSRIFHQCYLKCCKLQNLTPLNNVLPSGNGKVLDFCVDRIKYADWPPILNALSCDLSLHSVSIKCRQQVKTVLEHIDCERLAKTVNKRAVILTNFMLSNLVDATAQLLSNTTLLSTLLLEGLPLKIPYLNPFCEALLANNSLQHLYLPRCLLGDAGCLAVCKAVRCLPNILTLDLSGCELTPVGAGYIADLIKYQKIHRYSENWTHTLRYRLPELDAMAGLRRITLCGNLQLGDLGVSKLLDVLADDLWIKALDVQNCGLREQTATDVLQMLISNTTLVILDLRHNIDISSESLAKVRAALRENERRMGEGDSGQYSWLGNMSGCASEGRAVKLRNGFIKDRMPSLTKNASTKYTTKTNTVKKEKDYTDHLAEQLQEEISHRQQLEELNLQLVDQMKQLKQQQIRLWANGATSSGSEQSVQTSWRSGGLCSSSGSSSSVPIDQNTLSYIQRAFKDIYAFIKDNQCYGQCVHEGKRKEIKDQPVIMEEVTELSETDSYETRDMHVNIVPKKAQSSHMKLVENGHVSNKITKSAHMLGNAQRPREKVEMTPEMFERQMGDTKNSHIEDQCVLDEIIATQVKLKAGASVYSSGSSGAVSDSSDTLVYSRPPPARPNPRDALYSSDDDSA